MNSLQIERPRPGYVYFDLWRQLKEQCAQDDPQREAAYAWERALLLDGEDLVDGAITQASVRAAAVTYLQHLWTTYSPRFDPYFPARPYLRIGSLKREYGSLRYRARAKRNCAHASIHTHAIYLSCDGLTRSTLVHEVCHLLAWRDQHGPQFCGALLHLWQHEFGVDRNRALGFARKLGVAVEVRP